MNNQKEQPQVQLDLPAAHILARLINANETYLLAARGTWKTTRGISLYVIDKVYQMPRSSGVIVGLSFEHLGDNTIPPLLHSWAEFGLVHGEHFVYGIRPPDHWPKPFLGVINGKYDHCISFHNGTVIHLVSLKKKASANGISAQWGVFDEVKFMKEKTLVDEIFPIFRGNEKQFKFSSGYLSKFFATDKLADPAKIKWLLKKKDLNEPQKNAVIITLQQELNKLQQQFNDAGITKKRRLKKQMHAIETRLARLRSNLVLYLEASALDVVPVMGEKWLKDKERNMGAQEYSVSFLNKDPDRAGESFYPDYEPGLHNHQNPYDINPVKPFILAADYQHSISPLLVAQLCKLPGADDITLNFLDEVFTMGKQVGKPAANGNGKVGGLAAAVQMFCDRYKSHPTKVAHYVYDHTAVGRRVDADKYFEIVVKVLKQNRWAVRKIYTGQAPLHFQKYEDFKKYLAAGQIQINSTRCPKLIIGIQGSTAITSAGKTEKDKKNEKDLAVDQSETTHIPDVFDQILHAVFTLKRIKASAAPAGSGLALR